jgi:hypothetical protein
MERIAPRSAIFKFCICLSIKSPCNFFHFNKNEQEFQCKKKNYLEQLSSRQLIIYKIVNVESWQVKRMTVLLLS